MHGMSIVDGNAVAGMLADVIAGDPTTVRGTCGGCGDASLLAEAVVEIDSVAAIVRCRRCTMTLFTLVHADGRMRWRIGSLTELS